MAMNFTRTYRFICSAIVATSLVWTAGKRRVQLTSICYVQICLYSGSYSDFLWWIDRRSAKFADSTHSHRNIFVPITIALSYSSPMYANFINVEVRVCYSFLKHNIFSTKDIESFVVVWIVEETRLENRQCVSSTRLSKTLSLLLRTQRQCKWCGRK